MAFMGIFVLMIVGAIALLALMVFGAVLFVSAAATLASGVCWGIMKKKDIKHRSIPLVLFISFGILLAGLLGIVLLCHLALSSIGSSYDDQYIRQYTDLGIYAEETSDEIRENDCITLDGVKYYTPDSRVTFYYRGRELTEEYLTPVANVSDDSCQMIYDVKNDAGVRILWYDDHQFLTPEDTAKAQQYYDSIDVPQEMAVSKSSPNYGYKEIDFDTDLFNRLYAEWQTDGEEVHVMGSAEYFYILAFSPDNVSIRDMLISYKDGEVYFYKYHNNYPISDREARDALLQIAEEYCK